MRRAVFLDRDGTVNVKAPENDYVDRPERVELLPGAGRAIRRLNDVGLAVVVVTNQRGIARGVMTEQDLSEVHRELGALLAKDGARLDAIYFCPHEAGTCECRKPAPGLLLTAALAAAVDLRTSVMVGDSESDVQAGHAARTSAIRIGDPRVFTCADHVVADLEAAVDVILGGVGRQRQ